MEWCSFGGRRAFRTELGTDQLAAGRLMSRSSLIVAMVSSVMQRDRWTDHSRAVPDGYLTAKSKTNQTMFIDRAFVKDGDIKSAKS